MNQAQTYGKQTVYDRPRERRPKTFEDAELKALLDEDPCQTQGELAVGLTRQDISKRLHALEKFEISKVDYKIPCLDCSKTYVSQTGRMLFVRCDKHKKNINLNEKYHNLVTKHKGFPNKGDMF